MPSNSTVKFLIQVANTDYDSWFEINNFGTVILP
jgi:hypothetical protein